MILFTHHTGEPHGILGAQIAATYFTKRLHIPSIVVGITRAFSQSRLSEFLDEYYKNRERIIGFSHLCGRKDIIEFIGTLRNMGFSVILGGPQASQDYYGEEDTEYYPMRFKGLNKVVDLALKGPVDDVNHELLRTKHGCFEFPWRRDIFLNVDWSNLFVFSERLERLEVQLGQVLSSIGCPYAKARCSVTLDPPAFLQDRDLRIDIVSHGCTFCDVSKDKGFHGHVGTQSLMSQIRVLPIGEDERSIPFELIDEYPIVPLRSLLDSVDEAGIRLSQVNLVCRVDDILSHERVLHDTARIAREKGLKIMLASIGFESFSDTILRNFNKGITVEDIVKCVGILRRLKEEFGETFLYRRDEGANHGFIHPTPWDDAETLPEMNRNIVIHRLFEDVLPEHSTPLIIHHASYLGDWIREIEARTEIRFTRDGTWIEWWNPVRPEQPAGL